MGTIFCWMRVGSCAQRYKSSLIITGLVTFIAAYHYLRIFNSWTEAYAWTPEGTLSVTGVPFNDAYRYMDWLLTVPLLLIEIILVMKLDPAETVSKATTLGVASALMIILGYPGELLTDPDQLSGRWMWWTCAMVPFLFIVYTLLVGLNDATNAKTDPNISSLIKKAQVATVIRGARTLSCTSSPCSASQGAALSSSSRSDTRFPTSSPNAVWDYSSTASPWQRPQPSITQTGRRSGCWHKNTQLDSIILQIL